MNSIRSYQKFLNVLTGFAGLGLAAAVGGVLLDQFALGLYAVASGALVLLIAAHDYAPRASYATGNTVDSPRAPRARRDERMPLAA